MTVPTTSRPGQRPAQARRWDPFRELQELQNRTLQLVDTALARPDAENGDFWMPLVDIEEAEDAWIIEAELPGVDAKDVDVELRDSELQISGEVKERERVGLLRRRTRPVGRFEYRVTLPGETDPDAIDAKLHDGVLTLRIPKSDRGRARKVEVKGG